ncbi:MAG: tetratricopeptide repeat protein [Pyrinomonadaceae bacterium]
MKVRNRATVGMLAAFVVTSGSTITLQSQQTKQRTARVSSLVAQTRSRHAAPAQTPSNEVEKIQPTKPTETSAETPATNSASDPRQVIAEPKAKETSQPAPSTGVELKAASDPITELREQIAAAPAGPDRNRLQLKLVDQLIAADKQSDAVTELHLFTSTNDFDPQGLYNAANALAKLGDSDGAIAAYRKAIDQRKGRYSRALNNLGVVLLREGRWDESHEALLAAMKLENFHYPEATYNLGRLYSARGEVDLAVHEWRRVLAINPEHTAAKQALASASSEDRIAVRPAKEMAIDEASVANISATTAQSMRATTGRSSSSPKVMAVDQVTYDFLQRARTSSERNNPADAVESYRKVIARQFGYFAPANLELSYALVTLKRNDEAMANLQQVVDRDGARFPISYYHLARLYELRGDLKRAEELFNQAVYAYASKNSQFLLDLSRVREKQGNIAGALETLEQYVKEMQQQGRQLSWSEARVAALRAKLAAPK